MVDDKETTRQERRRASARRDCVVCLRLAARLASRAPHLPSFVVGMHARILSRALWTGGIVEANVDAIRAMLALTTEAEVKLRVSLAQALWAAHVAMGREPSLGISAKPRRRPGGEVRNFSDLSFEVHHAERRMELMVRKGDAAAARDWHKRLLRLTKLGRDLPIRSPFDAGHVLGEVWRRAKQYHSISGRRLRVSCRETSISLWSRGVQRGMRSELSALLPIAQQLDKQADAELHHDMSKVVSWLVEAERTDSHTREDVCYFRRRLACWACTARSAGYTNAA